MDGIKLNKWKENFHRAALSVQIGYDSYFQNKPFAECYVLVVDEANESLSLEILDSNLPEGIKERLEDLLETFRPEDSV